MFGFSLAELLVVCLIILIFIKPADLPEIAHFLGKIFFRIKNYYNNIKSEFQKIEKEIGLDEIKNELNRGIVEEKIKLEKEDATIIIDIYGNEHQVHNVAHFRSDTTKEEIDEEIKKLNEENSKGNEVSPTNQDHKQNQQKDI